MTTRRTSVERLPEVRQSRHSPTKKRTSMRQTWNGAQVARKKPQRVDMSRSLGANPKEWRSVYAVRDIPHLDSLKCKCGACKNLPSNKSLSLDALHQAEQRKFRIGDRVVLAGERVGTVKWKGFFDSDYVQTDLQLGIQLDNRTSRHNGLHNGKRYFTCPDNQGLFVSVKDVLLVRGRHELAYRPVNGEYQPPKVRKGATKAPKRIVKEPPRITQPTAEEMRMQASLERLRKAQERGYEHLRAMQQKKAAEELVTAEHNQNNS